MLKVDEFLPIFAQVKNAKDEGGFEDFMEVLRLYDKHENGTMLFAELQHILMAVGKSTKHCCTVCVHEEGSKSSISHPFQTDVTQRFLRVNSWNRVNNLHLEEIYPEKPSWFK